MTPKEKAISWIDEVGKTQAIIDCKKAIEKLEYTMDNKGYTSQDLAHLREYKDILKALQDKA
jgi:hypothetical protein